MKTTAIIPVKRLETALGRLADVLPAADRRRLAEAMFLDAIAKLRQSRSIDSTMIVTSDDSVSRQARWLGHSVLEQAGDFGHSEAAAAGASAAIAEGAER